MTENYHHGNLREELIAGGITMLNRDGIASFSLRKLSQELKVSHTAAYRHFASKEDLLRAMFAEVARQFRSALAESVLNGKGELFTGPEALTRLGTGYVRFFYDNPEYVPLFSLMNSANPFLEEFFPRSHRKILLRFRDGELPDAAADQFAENRSEDRDEAFELFRGVAQSVRSVEEYRHLEEYEILLGFWAKVHGLAILLVSHPDMIPPGKFDESLARLMEARF